MEYIAWGLEIRGWMEREEGGGGALTPSSQKILFKSSDLS